MVLLKGIDLRAVLLRCRVSKSQICHFASLHADDQTSTVYYDVLHDELRVKVDLTVYIANCEGLFQLILLKWRLCKSQPGYGSISESLLGCRKDINPFWSGRVDFVCILVSLGCGIFLMPLMSTCPQTSLAA